MTTKKQGWTELTAKVGGVQVAVLLLTADHGLRDRGRAVGGLARVEPDADWVEAQPGSGDGHRLPNEKWSVSIYATRDGRKYGATPRSTTYETLDEAKRAAEEGLVEQGKRYHKKFGAAR